MDTETIPPRRPGWEHAYAAELERQAARPFVWGRADCLTRVADLCLAMTGVNPMPPGMRRYRTAAGARRQMASLGFADVEEALAGTFPEVPRMKARRGDCGVAEVSVRGERVMAAFIVMGSSAIGANEQGPVIVATLSLKRTFRVG